MGIGFLVVIALSRMGPAPYGLYALAVAIVSWIEWTIASLFARVTIRAVSAADDWQPLAAGALHLHVAAGLSAGVLLWATARPVAVLMGVPALAGALRLLAIDIPLFTASWVHWNVAAGRGLFRARAVGSLARAAARLVFIGACVRLGLSVSGAILATIAASTLELALARRLVAIPLRVRSVSALRGWGTAVWLLGASAMAMRLYDKLDLFLLKALGAPLADVGIYAIAQNLTLLPALVTMSLGPSLLGMSARLRAEGRLDDARLLERGALGTVFWLVPVAAVIAAASRPIVVGFFGPAYGEAGWLLSILIAAAVAQALVVSIAAACVTLIVLRGSLGVTPLLMIPDTLRDRWKYFVVQRGQNA